MSRLILWLVLSLLFVVALLPAGLFLYLLVPNLLASGPNGIVVSLIAGLLSFIATAYLLSKLNWLAGCLLAERKEKDA